MSIIPGTERTKRSYAENIRRKLVQWDHFIWAKVDLDVSSEEAYRVIQLAPRKFAVVIDDPSLR